MNVGNKKIEFEFLCKKKILFEFQKEWVLKQGGSKIQPQDHVKSCFQNMFNPKTIAKYFSYSGVARKQDKIGKCYAFGELISCKKVISKSF